MEFKRTNHKTGQEYTFQSQGVLATKVTVGNKSIIINENIEYMRQAYYYWQLGHHIQDAFKKLSADEREFLLTGITPEEWAQMFPVEE